MADKGLKQLDQIIAGFEKAQKLCLSLEKEIKDIFAEITHEMGLRTINDTNQAKGIFIDFARSAFDVDISDILGGYYNYWGNNRFDGNGDFSYSMKRDGDSINVKFHTGDAGLYFQETGENSHEYPSTRHSNATGRDNSQFIPYHISFVCDAVSSKSLLSVEKKINILMDKILLLLAGEL